MQATVQPMVPQGPSLPLPRQAMAPQQAPHRRRMLSTTVAHLCAAPSSAERKKPDGFLASVSSDSAALGAGAPSKYALPPIPLTPENDLPSATSCVTEIHQRSVPRVHSVFPKTHRAVRAGQANADC
jgi:hypothetical protein